MITKEALEQEQYLKDWANQPKSKNQTHERVFDRDLYYYSLDEKARQAEILNRQPNSKVTYADHVKAARTAKVIFGANSQYEAIKCILTHRWFKDYRAKTFKGEGTLQDDFKFLAQRIGNIISSKTSKIIPPNIKDKIAKITTKKLVQVNYLTGSIENVKLPKDTKKTLQEWAQMFNEDSSETTVYIITRPT